MLGAQAAVHGKSKAGPYGAAVIGLLIIIVVYVITRRAPSGKSS
jgi:hypothetical protein